MHKHSIKVVFHDNNVLRLSVHCGNCNEDIDINHDFSREEAFALLEYFNGHKYAKRILGFLPIEWHDVFISGICPKCYKENLFLVEELTDE